MISSALTPAVPPGWTKYLESLRKKGSSIGAVVEVVAEGVPAGWGAPIYAKLDGELASALMSINAVKGVEIGDGFAAARLSGEENADEMRKGGKSGPKFLSNHAGGIPRRAFPPASRWCCASRSCPSSSILPAAQDH